MINASQAVNVLASLARMWSPRVFKIGKTLMIFEFSLHADCVKLPDCRHLRSERAKFRDLICPILGHYEDQKGTFVKFNEGTLCIQLHLSSSETVPDFGHFLSDAIYFHSKWPQIKGQVSSTETGAFHCAFRLAHSNRCQAGRWHTVSIIHNSTEWRGFR